MRRDAHVLIIEEDPFASNWMAMLVARDWRTFVSGETVSVDEADRQLKKKTNGIKFILLDADLVMESAILNLKAAVTRKQAIQILLIGNSPSPDVLRLALNEPLIAGYLLKSQIKHSLGWAIGFALEDYWVTSPGIQGLAINFDILLPKNKLILDGQQTISGLTDHETEVARLAFIFSMERRELADELGIVDDWSYGQVSALYKKLGMEELRSGETSVNSFFGDHPAILNRIQEIIEESKSSKKAKDMETLAFHIVTMPEIVS